MRKLSAKEVQLSVVLILMAAVVLIQVKRGAFSSSAGAQTDSAIGRAADPRNLETFTEVSLERLSPEAKIREDSRNLFNYAISPQEVAEQARQQKEAARLAAEAEERRRIQAEADALAARQRAEQAAVNPPKPPPPSINFKFIGKMGDSKAPLAILADNANGEIMTVREGEIIADKFKVLKIEFDSITIGYVKPEWTETRTLRMGS
jgi:hypothetical protein